eukprot:TRINITY_DN12684_c0_g1_i3.p1 TRINITY_DN12684_c0_g1~~TRINITY_DN12684_c0_g1_i3.p1  ORF type:complete len:166 (+),score=45.83 TRINITY_DN12684_c0_g1_i3:420-917(+)
MTLGKAHKKSRSFCEDNKKQTAKKSIQVFPCEAKELTEDSETPSEANEKSRASLTCSEKSESKDAEAELPEQQLRSEDRKDYPQIIITRCEPDTKAEAASKKKQRLFADFNEVFEARKKEIEQRKERARKMAEELMEKHPRLLNVTKRSYTKSTFHMQRGESAGE